VIDVRVGDEDGSNGFAVAGAQVSGFSAIEEVAPRVVVYRGHEADVLTRVTLVFCFDHEVFPCFIIEWYRRRVPFNIG